MPSTKPATPLRALSSEEIDTIANLAPHELDEMDNEDIHAFCYQPNPKRQLTMTHRDAATAAKGKQMDNPSSQSPIKTLIPPAPFSRIEASLASSKPSTDGAPRAAAKAPNKPPPTTRDLSRLKEDSDLASFLSEFCADFEYNSAKLPVPTKARPSKPPNTGRTSSAKGKATAPAKARATKLTSSSSSKLESTSSKAARASSSNAPAKAKATKLTSSSSSKLESTSSSKVARTSSSKEKEPAPAITKASKTTCSSKARQSAFSPGGVSSGEALKILSEGDLGKVSRMGGNEKTDKNDAENEDDNDADDDDDDDDTDDDDDDVSDDDITDDDGPGAKETAALIRAKEMTRRNDLREKEFAAKMKERERRLRAADQRKIDTAANQALREAQKKNRNQKREQKQIEDLHKQKDRDEKREKKRKEEEEQRLLRERNRNEAFARQEEDRQTRENERNTARRIRETIVLTEAQRRNERLQTKLQVKQSEEKAKVKRRSDRQMLLEENAEKRKEEIVSRTANREDQTKKLAEIRIQIAAKHQDGKKEAKEAERRTKEEVKKVSDDLKKKGFLLQEGEADQLSKLLGMKETIDLQTAAITASTIVCPSGTNQPHPQAAYMDFMVTLSRGAFIGGSQRKISDEQLAAFFELLGDPAQFDEELSTDLWIHDPESDGDRSGDCEGVDENEESHASTDSDANQLGTAGGTDDLPGGGVSLSKDTNADEAAAAADEIDNHASHDENPNPDELARPNAEPPGTTSFVTATIEEAQIADPPTETSNVQKPQQSFPEYPVDDDPVRCRMRSFAGHHELTAKFFGDCIDYEKMDGSTRLMRFEMAQAAELADGADRAEDEEPWDHLHYLVQLADPIPGVILLALQARLGPFAMITVVGTGTKSFETQRNDLQEYLLVPREKVIDAEITSTKRFCWDPKLVRRQYSMMQGQYKKTAGADDLRMWISENPMGSRDDAIARLSVLLKDFTPKNKKDFRKHFNHKIHNRQLLNYIDKDVTDFHWGQYCNQVKLSDCAEVSEWTRMDFLRDALNCPCCCKYNDAGTTKNAEFWDRAKADAKANKYPSITPHGAHNSKWVKKAVKSCALRSNFKRTMKYKVLKGEHKYMRDLAKWTSEHFRMKHSSKRRSNLTISGKMPSAAKSAFIDTIGSIYSKGRGANLLVHSVNGGEQFAMESMPEGGHTRVRLIQDMSTRCSSGHTLKMLCEGAVRDGQYVGVKNSSKQLQLRHAVVLISTNIVDGADFERERKQNRGNISYEEWNNIIITRMGKHTTTEVPVPAEFEIEFIPCRHCAARSLLWLIQYEDDACESGFQRQFQIDELHIDSDNEDDAPTADDNDENLLGRHKRLPQQSEQGEDIRYCVVLENEFRRLKKEEMEKNKKDGEDE